MGAGSFPQVRTDESDTIRTSPVSRTGGMPFVVAQVAYRGFSRYSAVSCGVGRGNQLIRPWWRSVTCRTLSVPELLRCGRGDPVFVSAAA